ncbi:phage portal protein [Candidimonas humi]|uniref:Phage portal protein n=1 Tax=Candidimonas humi TaxID=683355 RepID=A0ABV8NXV5_9BURK|nr:phage portal protein [Candidimonas humi]MBV6304930.1 phage portal protein [Candidimonas humi]
MRFPWSRSKAKQPSSLSPPTSFSSSAWLDITPAVPASYFQLDMRVQPEMLLQFPTVYACLTLIANDIGKLRARLMQVDGNGIWTETSSAAYSPFLRRPNRFQNGIQYRQLVTMSKLSWGNSYTLKQRDGRGVVTAGYVLDPLGVCPLVAPDGSIYYQVTPDNLSGLETKSIIVPASEIIHDRMNCLFHPLVGIGPLFAANLSAKHGAEIQKDSYKFFSQGAKPSGVLAAPGQISQQTALELRDYWNKNFTGDNAGRVAVVGDGLNYQPIRMNSTDAQQLEQLKLSAEFIAQTFHVPLFKLGIGNLPAGQKVGDMNLIYFQDCLHSLIEELEACLDEGLGLPSTLRTELELDNLLRMDPGTQADVLGKLVGGAIMRPNEARAKMNLPPTEGGDTVYLQQQNYSLAALARRDENPAPSNATPAPTSAPPNPEPDETGKALALLWKRDPETLTCSI